MILTSDRPLDWVAWAALLGLAGFPVGVFGAWLVIVAEDASSDWALLFGLGGVVSLIVGVAATWAWVLA